MKFLSLFQLLWKNFLVESNLSIKKFREGFKEKKTQVNRRKDLYAKFWSNTIVKTFFYFLWKLLIFIYYWTQVFSTCRHFLKNSMKWFCMQAWNCKWKLSNKNVRFWKFLLFIEFIRETQNLYGHQLDAIWQPSAYCVTRDKF